MLDIAKNITDIQSQILTLEKKYARKPGSVYLLAVSKGQPLWKIEAALSTGQSAFGENYLQEALPKIAALKLREKNIQWHFIGPIQSNKTREIALHFNWVHSVTSEKIAKRLSDQRPDSLPPLNICLEVNISREKTKHGLDFDEVFSLATYSSALPNLKLRGLMTVPAHKDHFIEQRAEFYKLRLLIETMREKEKTWLLDTLSIGMSGDMEAAIAEGGTLLRLGEALFGKRT